MKNILLIRHAKSSWDFPELDDKDRPLNRRGVRDGPFMAALCRQLNLIPDRLVSSPAKRAYSTAKFFHAEFSHEIGEIEKESDLYFGSERDWLYHINELPDGCKCPAYFSHNPTITYFSNSFQGDETDNVPTCGIVHLISSASEWSQVHYNNTKVENYYYPKLVRKA